MSYRLLSYKSGKDARAGILVGEAVHDVAKVTGKAAWSSVLALLQEWPAAHKALNAVADKEKVEFVQAKNNAEAMVHSVRKSLGEYGDKLDAGEKEKIEKAISDMEDALKGEDKAAIEAKNTALMEASQKLGEKVYAEMQAQQAAAGAGAAGAADAKPQDDNVVDAEVKEVKKG